MNLSVTLEDLTDKIHKADYHRIGETTATVCSLTLKSGFVVIGQSACINSDMFDQEVGCEAAYQDAIQKLWELEAYRVKENAFTQKQEQNNV